MEVCGPTVQLWNICKTEGWFHHQSDSSHIGNWKTGPFFWTNLFAQELSSRKVLKRKNLLKAFFEEDQFYWAKSWPLMVLGDNVLPNKCVIDLYDETICSHKQAGIQFSCVEVYIDGKKTYLQDSTISKVDRFIVTISCCFWMDNFLGGFLLERRYQWGLVFCFFPQNKWASEFNDKTIYSTLREFWLCWGIPFQVTFCAPTI